MPREPHEQDVLPIGIRVTAPSSAQRRESDTFATCNVVFLDTSIEKAVVVKGRSSGVDNDEATDAVSRVELDNDLLIWKGIQLQLFQCYICGTHELRINEIREMTQYWKKYQIPDLWFELATTCDTSQNRLENLHMQDSTLRERTSLPLVDASGCISMCIVNSASTHSSAVLRR
ncbi:hypothetical protein COCVIDRAFT_38809 [Bipolaris victoriae FI3]|uniref:Uncharacterized protein n=1 Tax=Bipolaris victoriae (strain FI3) TaxID=930091 RepID=W7EFV7_BIPV3|nr:hypothetical protein COCVIDRAFT_38809 [Bipolaris victoriae FI3]